MRAACAEVLPPGGLHGPSARPARLSATAGGGAPPPIALRLEDVANRAALIAALRRDEFIRAGADAGLMLISYDSLGALERVTYSHQLADTEQSETVEELFKVHMTRRLHHSSQVIAVAFLTLVCGCASAVSQPPAAAQLDIEYDIY